MRAAAVAIVALLVVVPACGEEGSDISETAAIQLDSQVQDLRRAAADGSREAAGQELAELRRLVEELSASGELGDDGAGRILAAAEEVEANLDLLVPTSTSPPVTTAPTTTTTTTTTTLATSTTTEEPPPPKDEEEQDQDRDEGDGQEGGDGDGDDRPPPGNGNRGRE